MTRRTLHEHWLEDEMTLQFAKAGHLCLKFVSPGFPGVPDRIILTTRGTAAFVECKAPGAPLRRSQPAVIEMLRKMGHRVEIIDTKSQVDRLLRDLA